MIEEKKIKEIVQRIVRAVKPEKIILLLNLNMFMI